MGGGYGTGLINGTVPYSMALKGGCRAPGPAAGVPAGFLPQVRVLFGQAAVFGAQRRKRILPVVHRVARRRHLPRIRIEQPGGKIRVGPARLLHVRYCRLRRPPRWDRECAGKRVHAAGRRARKAERGVQAV